MNNNKHFKNQRTQNFQQHITPIIKSTIRKKIKIIFIIETPTTKPFQLKIVNHRLFITTTNAHSPFVRALLIGIKQNIPNIKIYKLHSFINTFAKHMLVLCNYLKLLIQGSEPPEVYDDDGTLPLPHYSGPKFQKLSK